MARGNNNAGKQERASFATMGNMQILLCHPYFAKQIDTNENIDTIDITSALLFDEGNVLEATPTYDKSKQVVMVNGSTMTFTNNLGNGIISMNLVSTNSLLAFGDAVEAMHIIGSSGDSVGGLVITKKKVNGKTITKIFFGVTLKSIPDDILNPYNPSVYPTQLFYSGWAQACSDNDTDGETAIWAVGNDKGLKGFYRPYRANNFDGNGGTQDQPITETTFPSRSISNNTKLNVDVELSTGKIYNVRGDETSAGGECAIVEVSEVLEK